MYSSNLLRAAVLVCSGVACVALSATFSACVKDRLQPVEAAAPEDTNLVLLHYWNFNDSMLLSPESTIGGGAITIANQYDAVENGTLVNARNGDDTGAALRVRNPSTTMTWALPTTGYKTPVVSFALMRTDSGPQQNNISYTTDGVTYTSAGISPSIINVTTAWTRYSIDFAGVAGTADNPKFAVKITFATGNDGISGNDRYDNIACEAEALPPAPVAGSDSLLHYWNFNAATADVAAFGIPTKTTGGAMLLYSAASDTSHAGTTINAIAGDVAGGSLRLKNPSGNLTLTLPATGYKDLIVRWATARNSTGPQQQNVAYSLDGLSYTSAGLPSYSNASGTAYTRVVYDFSGIQGVADNPDFKVRISFSVGNGNASGYTLIDNITMEGNKL